MCRLASLRSIMTFLPLTGMMARASDVFWKKTMAAPHPCPTKKSRIALQEAAAAAGCQTPVPFPEVTLRFPRGGRRNFCPQAATVRPKKAVNKILRKLVKDGILPSNGNPWGCMQHQIIDKCYKNFSKMN